MAVFTQYATDKCSGGNDRLSAVWRDSSGCCHGNSRASARPALLQQQLNLRLVHCKWTPVLTARIFQRKSSQRTNWPSTNRPSFSTASRVATLTRVTSERIVYNWVDLLQVGSAQFLCCEQVLILNYWVRSSVSSHDDISTSNLLSIPSVLVYTRLSTRAFNPFSDPSISVYLYSPWLWGKFPSPPFPPLSPFFSSFRPHSK